MTDFNKPDDSKIIAGIAAKRDEEDILSNPLPARAVNMVGFAARQMPVQ